MRLHCKILVLLFLTILFSLFIFSRRFPNWSDYARPNRHFATNLKNETSEGKNREQGAVLNQMDKTLQIIRKIEESATPSDFVDVLKSGVAADAMRNIRPEEPKHKSNNNITRTLWDRAKHAPKDSDLNIFVSEQYRRRQHIAKFCSRATVYFDQMMPQIAFSNLIYDSMDHITFCPVYKAASTSWTVNLLQLRGVAKRNGQNIRNMQLVLKMTFPKLSMGSGSRLVKNTIKFMIVRHPFERLLSCYKDKYENGSKEFYYKVYGEQMVRMYRNISKKFTEQDKMKMLHFVRKLVERKAKPYNGRKDQNPYTEPIGPTFAEFTHFIIHSKRVDEHWRPYYEHCASCFINYDFIMRFENLGEESTHLIDFLNRTDELDLRWLNKGMTAKSTKDVSCQYFSQLTVDMVRALLTKYAIDFKLFEYSADKHVKCASDYVEGMKINLEVPKMAKPFFNLANGAT